MDKKTRVLIEATRALKEAIQDNLPETVSGEKPNLFNRYDDIRLKELDDFPAIVILTPDPKPFYLVQTQDFVYEDIDRVNGVVKQKHPPQATRLHYTIISMCHNPDNDLIIAEAFRRFEDVIPELKIKILEEQEVYTKSPVYWKFLGKIDEANQPITRTWDVHIQLNLGHNRYKTRNLLDPLDPINYSLGLTDVAGNLLKSPCGYSLTGELAYTMEIGETTVYTCRNTKLFPLSGTIEFLRNGERFNYSTKTYNSLVGLTGIINVHRWSEEFRLVESG